MDKHEQDSSATDDSSNRVVLVVAFDMQDQYTLRQVHSTVLEAITKNLPELSPEDIRPRVYAALPPLSVNVEDLFANDLDGEPTNQHQADNQADKKEGTDD